MLTVYVITVVVCLAVGVAYMVFGDEDLGIADIIGFVLASFVPVINLITIVFITNETVESISKQWKWSSKHRRFIRRIDKE